MKQGSDLHKLYCVRETGHPFNPAIPAKLLAGIRLAEHDLKEALNSFTPATNLLKSPSTRKASGAEVVPVLFPLMGP